MKFFDYNSDEIPEEFKSKPNELQFKYGGKVYECIGENKEFQITQFNYLIKTQDWITLKNRITNQLLWGPFLKEIKL